MPPYGIGIADEACADRRTLSILIDDPSPAPAVSKGRLGHRTTKLVWADSIVDWLDHQHVVRRSRRVGLYVVADPPRATLESSVRIQNCSEFRLVRPGMAIAAESFAAQRPQANR